ncbi:hypothetical protein DPMN_049074 [Dreissena polymorpha]|uniref:Uncharacterized protein n=1 Tax=Dreissena polymorpha TaxID=45954 RepID=A0A9D4I2V1_DREPO|nr:hypothetical protein DPMN_049023 [Dreissena polymorpha]KAH3742333.1 hypothetical protein DPMN_049074 [Dreissena polymorpha]
MNIRPAANINDATYIVHPASMVTAKQAYEARLRSRLRRLRSKLFHGDKKKLQSTLPENFNSDKQVNKCNNKDIYNATRSATYQICKLVPPIRLRGDGADDVAMIELIRTRGDGADGVPVWELPARTPGDGIDDECHGVCDLDAAFLAEEETCDVCDLDMCMIDESSVTTYPESAYIEAYEGDSVCELEKNVFDDVDVSITTLTRLRSVFSKGGIIEGIVNDSALESFMRD